MLQPIKAPKDLMGKISRMNAESGRKQ